MKRGPLDVDPPEPPLPPLSSYPPEVPVPGPDPLDRDVVVHAEKGENDFEHRDRSDNFDDCFAGHTREPSSVPGLEVRVG